MDFNNLSKPEIQYFSASELIWFMSATERSKKEMKNEKSVGCDDDNDDDDYVRHQLWTPANVPLVIYAELTNNTKTISLIVFRTLSFSPTLLFVRLNPLQMNLWLCVSQWASAKHTTTNRIGEIDTRIDVWNKREDMREEEEEREYKRHKFRQSVIIITNGVATVLCLVSIVMCISARLWLYNCIHLYHP